MNSKDWASLDKQFTVGVELTIIHHCLKSGLMKPKRWQTIIWTDGGIFYWCIYVSLGGNELIVFG